MRPLTDSRVDVKWKLNEGAARLCCQCFREKKLLSPPASLSLSLPLSKRTVPWKEMIDCRNDSLSLSLTIRHTLLLPGTGSYVIAFSPPKIWLLPAGDRIPPPAFSGILTGEDTRVLDQSHFNGKLPIS